MQAQGPDAWTSLAPDSNLLEIGQKFPHIVYSVFNCVQENKNGADAKAAQLELLVDNTHKYNLLMQRA